MKSKDNQFVTNLLEWFKENKRHFSWRNSDLTPFQILIAEIMLQKTGATQVEKLFPDFIKAYPNPKTINELNIKILEEILHPLGLYQRRARDIKKTAKKIWENGNKLPKTKKDLMALPGVGEYIANAILCFAFQEPVPIIDANVGRVIKRVFSFPVKSAPSRDKKLLERMMDIIPEINYKEFNLAILDFAALICIPRNPRCENCPLSKICEFNAKYI
ncbi:MAG: hypothetical protein ACFFBP_22080 [Promethearchaeota archaeon]